MINHVIVTLIFFKQGNRGDRMPHIIYMHKECLLENEVTTALVARSRGTCMNIK